MTDYKASIARTSDVRRRQLVEVPNNFRYREQRATTASSLDASGLIVVGRSPTLLSRWVFSKTDKSG